MRHFEIPFAVSSLTNTLKTLQKKAIMGGCNSSAAVETKENNKNAANQPVQAESKSPAQTQGVIVFVLGT